jgi:hypothetical protein
LTCRLIAWHRIEGLVDGARTRVKTGRSPSDTHARGTLVPPWPTKCVSLNAESKFEGMEFHDLACPACAMPSVWGRTAPLIETAWAYAASRSKGGQRGDCDRLESFQRTYPLAGDRVGRHGLALSHGRRRNGVPLVWARTNGSGTRVAPRYDRRRRRSTSAVENAAPTTLLGARHLADPEAVRR